MNFKAFKERGIRELRGLGALAYLSVFVACAAAMTDALGDAENAPGVAKFVAGAALVFGAWTFIIAIHEIGHASLAWLMGWRVPVIAIRGMTIWPPQRRIKFGLPAFPGLGGAVLAVPRNPGYWRLRHSVILLGGAAANFILAAAAGLAGAELQNGVFWPRYFDVIATLSAMTGLINLAPFRVWGTRSDGVRIFEILRGRDITPDIHISQLFEEATEKKRPRDWNPALVQQVRQDFDADRGDGYAGLLLFSRYFDQRDMVAARAALDWAENKRGSSDAGVRILRAVLLAYVDGDADAARNWIAPVKSRKIKATPDYWIALTAIEWARKDPKSLGAPARRARAALKRSPFAIQADFEFLDELEGLQNSATPVGESAFASS